MHYILAKVGRRDHMQALVEGGVIRMQELRAYRSYKSEVIGDPDEALYLRFSGSNPSLTAFIEAGSDTIPFSFRSLTMPDRTQDHGAYCMYGIPSPKNDGVLTTEALLPIFREDKFLEFGDTLIVFSDTKEFVRRLNSAAKRAGLKLVGRPVEYVKDDHCGDMGPFRKLDHTATNRNGGS